MGQKNVVYSSLSGNDLEAYALTKNSFSERVINFVNGNDLNRLLEIMHIEPRG